MKKILSLLVLGSFCALNIFAMEKKEVSLNTSFLQAISSADQDAPINAVKFEHIKRIIEISNMLKKFDSNSEKQTQGYVEKISTRLDDLVMAAGKTTESKKEYGPQYTDYSGGTDRNEYDLEIPISGKYEFVEGIKKFKKIFTYVVSCKLADMKSEKKN